MCANGVRKKYRDFDVHVSFENALSGIFSDFLVVIAHCNSRIDRKARLILSCSYLMLDDPSVDVE